MTLPKIAVFPESIKKLDKNVINPGNPLIFVRAWKNLLVNALFSYQIFLGLFKPGQFLQMNYCRIYG